MRLLFDQNLSHRLVKLLSSEYPGSGHVRDVGLNAADDRTIWDYAARNGFVIVSKDSDFEQRPGGMATASWPRMSSVSRPGHGHEAVATAACFGRHNVGAEETDARALDPQAPSKP